MSDDWTGDYYAMKCDEKDDEITRLRADNEKLRDDARATNAALSLQRYSVDTHTMMKAALKTANDLAHKYKSENEKLRGALKPFVNMIDEKFQIYEYNDICMSLVNYDVLMRICNNAKDALEGATNKSGDENE